ncbi:MAG: phytanoyl-CoA dioxygenase family protein [Verrucomicrobiota bacterium]
MALRNEGFSIRRNVVDPGLLEELRKEADRVATEAESVCVRHLRSRSPVFRRFATHGAMLSLLPSGLLPVRSILFDKCAEANWPVAWHRDLTIALQEELSVAGYGPWSVKEAVPHVQPPRDLLAGMWTLRLHLDDTPSTNGALKVLPGSHQWPIDEVASASDLKEKAVTCCCRAGDVLIMSPLLLHASGRSEKPARRRVLHFEYADPGVLDPPLRWYELPGVLF